MNCREWSNCVSEGGEAVEGISKLPELFEGRFGYLGRFS